MADDFLGIAKDLNMFRYRRFRSLAAATRIAGENRRNLPGKPGDFNSVASRRDRRSLALSERILDDPRSGYKTTTGIPINIYYIAKLKLCIGCLRYR